MKNLNKDWLFAKDESAGKLWQAVNLPHTWNVEDVMDDKPGYYRGVGWYKKTFELEKGMRTKELFLHFEGANQETDVFINGKKAGQHIGGYTGFVVPITPLVKLSGPNELLVKVNNAHNRNIPPLTADFTFYGGLYRDVYLVATEPIHFNHSDGSDGVFITTPFVAKDRADVVVKTFISNKKPTSQAVQILTTVFNRKKQKVAERSANILINAGATKITEQTIAGLKNPHLWSPENPYLYTVEAKLMDKQGKVLDVVRQPLGFRWFHFDAARGFHLNGTPYKLIGASRHQDYKGLGNAVPDSLAVNDVLLLKTMGGNFLRVAHYPQDPSVLRACDSLGLLASVEIPVVNEITETDSFYTACERMQTEMILQHFNHPSVIMWCYMNEVLLRPQFNDNKDRQNIYFANIKALAQRLESLTRKLDPHRYTMMANHGSLKQYQSVGLLDIPMVVGWNLYSGWYGGSMDDFPAFLDNFHKKYPTVPFLVTEYGADADPRIRSLQPVRFDKSIEYTTRFHQFYLNQMLKRPFVAGAIIWNLADFNSETRSETMPHINNKGLLAWDRTPKDPYHFYKAALTKAPFIKILGSGKTRFAAVDTTTEACFHPIQIASNFDSVVITANRAYRSTLLVSNALAEGKLSLLEGLNHIVAEGKHDGKTFRDSISFEALSPQTFFADRLDAQVINVMLGSNRFYEDTKGKWWVPDHTYSSKEWGSVGGKPFRMANNNRLPYGTDKSISGTDDDPIYQTQQTGIRHYRLNAPAGTYQLSLHFAELLGGKTLPLPYNLQNAAEDEEASHRVFHVSVNGERLLNNFNIAAAHGHSTAVVKTITVNVKDKEGIQVDFIPVEGEPVLNALQLKKIDDKKINVVPVRASTNFSVESATNVKQ